MTIGELYQPIAQQIELNKLNSLPYYQKFKEAVRNIFTELGYLH
ncbi:MULTISPECIES: hypothetical protein [Aerosakkonema]